MISVAEALSRILGPIRPLPTEVVPIARARGRALAEDVRARVTQPPKDVSAMDGYAVRAEDLCEVPARLRVIGEAPAGGAHDGALGPGEAVRIFTGGPVPAGADAIVIQEGTENAGEGEIEVRESVAVGTYIRPAGLDFVEGQVGVGAGTRLGARDIGLAAAMNVPWLTVRRRPRIALLATGDEIVRPGEPIAENQIVSSNTLALAALVEGAGGEAIDLGIARDDMASIDRLVDGARGADILVTLGGASVGDHDLVRDALAERGLELDFWRIAMRPGKPLMFGLLDRMVMLGLPGNPVSSLVCGTIFLRPAIRALLGLEPASEARARARLGRDLAENDRREDYLRAELRRDGEGAQIATPFQKQDSSMLSLLARAHCLVVRPPHAPAIKAGEEVDIVPFGAEFGEI